MGYTEADLAIFQTIAEPGALKGTSYFELHPREVPSQNACWLPGSLFVRDAAFDFFTECFHRASVEFDYFSFQRFGRTEISALRSELATLLEKLRGGPARATIFSRYNSLFTLDIWASVPTEALQSSVLRAGETIFSFVEQEPVQTECLWVLGM